jgi:hypothetical protein
MSTRRTADIVLCLDASGSMRPCIDAVKKHLGDFVDSLSGDAQIRWDLRFDFLAHAAGETSGGAGVFNFRCRNAGTLDLIEALYEQSGQSDVFFTRDLDDLKRGLATIEVGGDEAPLIALDTALDFPWRDATTCHRVVIMLTDEALETGVCVRQQIERINDLVEKIHKLRVILFLVAPSSDAFDQLCAADKSEFMVVDEPHNGLSKVAFSEVLASIGKSVSVSALQGAASNGKSARRALFGQDKWGSTSEALRGG